MHDIDHILKIFADHDVILLRRAGYGLSTYRDAGDTDTKFDLRKRYQHYDLYLEGNLGKDEHKDLITYLRLIGGIKIRRWNGFVSGYE